MTISDHSSSSSSWNNNNNNNMLSSWFTDLPHTWNAPMQPDRTPLFIIPSIVLSDTLSTPELEFYFVKISFWLELLLIFLSMTLFAIGWGCVLYQYCVRPEAKFTTTSYLVGYGIILPFWLVFPATASYLLGIRNKIFRFGMTTCVTAICSFRTTAAVHGFSPEHTTRSMRDFVFYYSTPVLAKFDTKTQQYVENTHAIRIGAYLRFYAKVFVAGMMTSLVQMYPEIFPLLVKERTATSLLAWYDWRTFMDLNNLKDNLLLAAFFQVYLSTFSEGLMAVQRNLTHIETEEMMDNPVFGSTCPSDFWGRRWNLLIHDVLKRGVFLPVRKCASGSLTVAVMAAFFASGLFHEWLQLTVFASWDYTLTEDGKCYLMGYSDDNGSIPVSPIHCYSPQWGAAMAFFIWQAILVAIEFALRPYCHKGFFLHHLPNPVKTMLTVLSGACVAHWFYEPYIHSNFFLDGNLAMFYVKRVEHHH